MGHFQGGNHNNIAVINQRGNVYNKNGRRLPNLPGFLLSTITQKIIARMDPIISWDVTPIDTSIEFKLIV
jgi:hypothetical protein